MTVSSKLAKAIEVLESAIADFRKLQPFIGEAAQATAYVTQSDWMAQNKTKSTWAAFCHATVYALPFLAIASVNAWLVIWIDRFRLARYVVYAKNWLAPRSCWHPWSECVGTGYHKDSPPWLAVWLMIAADNTLHLGINYLAIATL